MADSNPFNILVSEFSEFSETIEGKLNCLDSLIKLNSKHFTVKKSNAEVPPFLNKLRPEFYEDFEDDNGMVFHGAELAVGKVCFLILKFCFLKLSFSVNDTKSNLNKALLSLI